MNIEESEVSLENLPNDELIKILDANNFSCDEEFDGLIKEMEKRGMSGRIVQIDGSPDDEQGKQIIEYIEYHNKMPVFKNDIEWDKAVKNAIKTLRDKSSKLEELKLAIILLAHSGRIDSLRELEKFQKLAPQGLVSWTFTAVGECQMFLEEKLTERPTLKVKKMPK